MSTTTVTRKYVSIAEGADYFGVSERTIRRMIADGKMAAFRVGRSSIRIPIAELERIESANPIGNRR